MPDTAATGRKAAKYAPDWVAIDAAGKACGAQLVIMMDVLSRSEPDRPKYQGFGRPRMHADDTIIAMLTLRSVLRLSLREVEGLALELRAQQGGDWDVPGHTTLSRRMGQLAVPLPKPRPGERLVIALGERWHVFGDGRGRVQRDVYSAFLARNSEGSTYDPPTLERAWRDLASVLARMGWYAPKQPASATQQGDLLLSARGDFAPRPSRSSATSRSGTGDAAQAANLAAV